MYKTSHCSVKYHRLISQLFNALSNLLYLPIYYLVTTVCKPGIQRVQACTR